MGSGAGFLVRTGPFFIRGRQGLHEEGGHGAEKSAYPPDRTGA